MRYPTLKTTLIRLLLPGLILLGTLGIPVQTEAQSLAHDREARFGKGVNLSNWLEAYWLGGNWPEPARYDKQDLQAIKDAGMQTIRAPFCFAIITDTVAPYNVDFAHPAIAWLDSLVQWCDDLQLNLIIDNQHEWNLTNANYQAKILVMTAMWRQVVNRYASLDPERYFFEVRNGPPVGLLPANADAVNTACIDTIRQYDQVHTLIVGPHTASIGSSFLTFQPYADTNLIYTFHTYEPLYFTHQGFPWFQIPFPTGTPFPLIGDDALVRGSVQAPADWRDTHNRPVFMGEFGTGIHGDADSRCNWVTLMGELIDEFDFNWCYWDWGGVAPSDFSMFNAQPPTSGNIIPCFAEALGLYTPTGAPGTAEASWLEVWPNPVEDVLHIRAEERMQITLLEVVDLHGKVVLSREEIRGITLALDVEGLVSGWYLLRVSNGQGQTAVHPFMRR